MSELVVETLRSTVVGCRIENYEFAKGQTVVYSLYDEALEKYCDQDGSYNSAEVKIECHRAEVKDILELNPNSFGSVEEFAILTLNLYSDERSVGSFRIDWPDRSSDGKFSIRLKSENYDDYDDESTHIESKKDDGTGANTGNGEGADANTGDGGEGAGANTGDGEGAGANTGDGKSAGANTGNQLAKSYRNLVYFASLSALVSAVVLIYFWNDINKLFVVRSDCLESRNIIAAVQAPESKDKFLVSCADEITSLKKNDFDKIITNIIEIQPNFLIEQGDRFNPNLEDSFLRSLRPTEESDLTLAIEFYHDAYEKGITGAKAKLDLLCSEPNPSIKYFASEYCNK